MKLFDRIRARFAPRRTPTLDELTAENRRRYAAQHARLAENLRQCEDMCLPAMSKTVYFSEMQPAWECRLWNRFMHSAFSII